jgi:hypothetical protein
MASVADLLKHINLNNVGAAVKGMDKAATEINDKRFALRAQELAAKQKSLITRKNANYEIDLKAYAKEKSKANAIKSLNAEGDIGSYNYATKWLNITDSGFKDYKESQQNNMITSFMTTLAKNKDADGNIIAKTYTATGASKEELEAKYAANEAAIMKIISDETIKQSEKNFLIDKIVGIKDEDTDIDAQIAAALKAEKKVEDVTNSTLTATTLTEDKIPANVDSEKFKVYKNEVASLNSRNAWKNERDGVSRMSFASTAKGMGFDTKNYVNYVDGKPQGFNISGDSFGNAYEKIYNTKHAENNKQNFSLELYLANNDKGTLASNPKLSNGALHSDTQRILHDRGTEVEVRGENSFSMVPLNMVNDNNKLVYDGKTYTLTNNQLLNGKIPSAKTIYNKQVGNFVLKELEVEGWAGKDEVHRAYSIVQNGLTDGHATYAALDNHIKEKIIKELKLVPDADKKVTTTEATVTEEKKVTDVEKTDKKVTGDKSHIIVQNGKIIDTKTGNGESLDSINKNGKIDLLPDHIKNSKEFKTWASKNKINVFKAPILGEEPEFIYKTNRKGVRVKVKNPNYIDTSPKKVTQINKKRVR